MPLGKVATLRNWNIRFANQHMAKVMRMTAKRMQMQTLEITDANSNTFIPLA